MRFSYDPYLQSPYFVRGNTFHYLINGPEGSIIGNFPSRSRYFHQLDSPDAGSVSDIGFNAKKVELPVTNVRTLPYFPNFRLYDLQGSPCDTLGIDGATVATETIVRNLKMRVFPNPASDQITILLPESPQPTQVLLYDLQGRKLRETSIPSHEKQVHLSLASLTNGAYMLIWKSDTGSLLSKEGVLVQK